ncbi:protein involved in gliding motility GldM [Flavobacterium sp. 90]|uniref:type IX secretion system motor protein PorM/GldM n=1 Tax=unclassified Flavobacterium TaxID=196869 RepID=UPI000EB539E8|nr:MULTISPECIES: gliding motility protein GldM [unclassified Flavobacterium]RKR04909.1 protein involved in gliding motility GldM [Flavobacterium sp. 81]TCK56229.1 protein involved in gliding motility GldM [Flavobacterium sp. 90]
MAGGKLTPRQKMINLMYLVFIAMLAMNMSKEVLSAFGLMNEKFESANTSSEQTNDDLLKSLDQKASEAKGEYAAEAIIAHKVKTISKEFYTYIGSLKGDILKGFETDKETGKLPYESMDKGDTIDNWFTGEGYTTKGNDIISHIEKYKAAMKSALSDKKYAVILAEIEKKFDISDVANKEGLKDKYLAYHFKGFPAVASLAKLSAWQNDVQKAESDVYSAALGKAAVAEASYSKFQAIVVLDKNAYFQGEKVTGKVVLGKYDPNAQFSDFKGPGKLVNGQALLEMTAGGVGEQKIGGSFNFVENGKPINLPFNGTYVVVPRPNSATISADKMNVVYRGVVNPISVSFAGVADNKVVASAPGLSSAGKAGKYNMSPGSGTETTISVTGTLPNGDQVTDKKTFRIKGIPGPTGTIRGEMGIVKGPRSNLEIATIGANLLDFDFEVGLEVIGFNLKIAGQPTVVVSGNKLNAQCKQVLSRAGKGDQVTISEIKTKLAGAGSYLLPRTAPVIYEIL